MRAPVTGVGRCRRRLPSSTLAQLTAVSANEPGEDEQRALRAQARASCWRRASRPTTISRTAPLRRSEFYSSGFLTEKQKLPFGTVLGPVTPQQMRANSANANAMPFSTIAVEAPRGATYQIGDTLLVASLGPELDPTARWWCRPASSASWTRCRAATWRTSSPPTGRSGTASGCCPAEKFTPSGEAHAVPVTEGVRATVHRRPRPPGHQGAPDGRVPRTRAARMASRRATCSRSGAAPSGCRDGRQLINEVMATMQIVHVRDHTATARLSTSSRPTSRRAPTRGRSPSSRPDLRE